VRRRFDVFRIDLSGEFVWIGEGASLDHAVLKAKEVLASHPECDFCMIDQEPGNRGERAAPIVVDHAASLTDP